MRIPPCRDAIVMMLLWDRSLSSKQIQQQLAWVSYELTTFAISSIKRETLHSFKVIEDELGRSIKGKRPPWVKRPTGWGIG